VKPLYMVLLLASAMASGDRHKAEPPQSVRNGSPVRLLPGYHHTPSGGVDTRGGRIWKDNGPEIYYVIGPMVGELARGYSQQNPKASLSVVESPATGELAIAMDEENDALIVSIDHRSNFRARNVRSRKDVVDVILMANTVARAPK